MSAPLISYLAKQYRDEAEILVANKASLPPEHMLACLITRDRISHLWKKEGPSEPDDAQLIIEGDQHLREMIDTISWLPELEIWRMSFNPSKDAWWWPEPSQDSLPKKGLSERFNWVWTAISLALLGISLSLIADISSRFLSGDTDAYGIFAVVVPTILTLITTRSVLTEAGQETIRRVLGSLRFIPNHWHEELGLIASTLLLITLTLFWFSLPWIARWYNDQGLQKYEMGKFASAQADFGRALKLDPGLLEIHYNLGVLYEDLNDYEKARAEYELAIQGTKLDAAYNNLARMYILNEQYDRAAQLLITVDRENLIQDIKVSYDVKKNLGWSRLGQERYDEAKLTLEEAIKIYPERAPAYCLLAQVLQAQESEKTNIDEAWSNCRAYADASDPDEDIWLGLSYQYFQLKTKQGGSE